MNNKRLVQDQTKIIHMISSGEQLQKVLHYIISSMENQFQIPMFGSVMLYDPSEEQLTSLVSASLPDDYAKLIQPMDIGPYEGSCGTAAFFKQTVIVSDIDHDPLWDSYRNQCKQYGFKACWSVPILSPEKELLGTFALYFKKVYESNKEIMNIVKLYTQLASIAIEFSKKINKNKEKPLPYDLENKIKTTEMPTADKNELIQLHKALERSEFEVYYQPYFGVKTKDFGMEALIRWNHPNTGLLNPGAFLEVAEKTGFILKMEEWVLTESIQHATNLRNSGLEDLTLSVNISAQQFENQHFPGFVNDVLQRFSYNPANLTLEVTERFLIKEANIDVLNQLKDIGIRISIDDFGTSYSSLQYLKDLNVDELKIDRSFISNMETNLDNQKIVEMIIMLGHQLQLNIVAEGVETKEQLQLLKNMECDQVQGFLFSKPLPLEEFKEKYAV